MRHTKIRQICWFQRLRPLLRDYRLTMQRFTKLSSANITRTATALLFFGSIIKVSLYSNHTQSLSALWCSLTPAGDDVMTECITYKYAEFDIHQECFQRSFFVHVGQSLSWLSKMMCSKLSSLQRWYRSLSNQFVEARLSSKVKDIRVFLKTSTRLPLPQFLGKGSTMKLKLISVVASWVFYDCTLLFANCVFAIGVPRTRVPREWHGRSNRKPTSASCFIYLFLIYILLYVHWPSV